MSRFAENFGWSFWNRPFLSAFAVSLLWHFFWFFSVTIVVSSRSDLQKPRPRMVSLGSVLSDDIFRELVENRIETTPAFYRPRLASAAAALPAETARRHAPGDVVSVPFGAKAQTALDGLIGGVKAAPDFDLTRPPVDFTGPAAGRAILFSPPTPSLPAGLDSAAAHAATRIRFSIDASGSVVSAEIFVSSGHPQADLLWLEYLRRFQFAPRGGPEASGESEAALVFEAGGG